ncbi:MAG: hypothetical protein Q7V62_02030, partial [Actinomycetota bacterium]|nr:hypothetical protein [Actinomycetota bacterium]
ARWTEEVMFYAHVNSNGGLGPTMTYDSTALFDAAGHGNYQASGAVPSQTTIDAGFTAMSALLDIDGTNPIAVSPKFIVHSYRHRGASAKALGLWAPQTESTQKLPYTEPLRMVLSPAYTGNSWLLVADPAIMPAFLYGYLAGSEGPRVSQNVDFATNDLQIKVGIDWGCRAIEHRAVYKNVGA